MILAMFQIFDGELDKIRLQKLLFLFTQQQSKAEYNFVPYRFGCYSYSANADLTTMVSKGMLQEHEHHFCIKDRTDYFTQLKPEDRLLMQSLKNEYGRMTPKALMQHVYRNFPFYAINSEAAENILNKEELKKIEVARPTSNNTILFTIGYEGISPEEYLVRLISNDVKVLVDVRRNALSMKYGFSKQQLMKFCRNLGIEYLHIPEVGIESDLRQELKSQSDYDKLFEIYRAGTLKKNISAQKKIFDLLKEKQRIALTCFEANIDQCLRKHLSEAIAKLPQFEFEVKHI